MLKVKRLHEDAVIPRYAHAGDSGFDLVAVEDVIVEPGETVKVPIGLAFEIPFGYELQIRPRSGITTKTKLRVQFGTVDAGYRGEVAVAVDHLLSGGSFEDYLLALVDGNYLTWLDGEADVEVEGKYYFDVEVPYLIRKGDRIAQGVIAPVARATFEEADELDETARGAGGFGSTGVTK